LLRAQQPTSEKPNPCPCWGPVNRPGRGGVRADHRHPPLLGACGPDLVADTARSVRPAPLPRAASWASAMCQPATLQSAENRPQRLDQRICTRRL